MNHYKLCIWVIMYQCKFTNFNKSNILLGDAGGGIWEISLPFLHFFSEPKNALKQKILMLKKYYHTRGRLVITLN